MKRSGSSPAPDERHDPHHPQQGFAADRIDTATPHPARMYDYFLGGRDNYAVDRVAAQRIIKAAPEVRPSVRANRDFLQRAVRWVAQQGVGQFLDIGTGLPTPPSVHEVAKTVVPGARTAYVDNDPIVHVHANALLHDAGSTSIVLADLRDTQLILGHPRVRALIDFDRPVALLLLAILHFVPGDEDPLRIVAELCDALPVGSHVVISHTANDIHDDRTEAAAVYDDSTAALHLRSHGEILRLFPEGFSLVEPGLVQVPFWRPDGPVGDDAASVGYYGGVARKDAAR